MSSFNSSDSCLSSPCQNGGRCINIGLYYFCYCDNNFRGSHCQFGGNFCVSSPCRNGGICNSLTSNYFCSCVPGYSGDHCEIPLPCASSPCQNGGTCQSWSSNYWCSCQTGYSGTRCEIRAKSQNLQEDFTRPTPTPTPTAITDTNTTNGESPVWMFPVIALLVSIIIIITVVCSLTIAKKRKRRQRDQQLCLGPPDTIVRSISGNLQSDTRVGTLTSVSDHPTSPHPYSVHYATRHFQTSTFVIELESSHLSPQQPHLHDNDESRPDGGSVNHHVRDLPPSYLSVVTDPRYIREKGDSLQQPPSYDDVVAVMRQTKASSDRPVTSTR